MKDKTDGRVELLFPSHNKSSFVIEFPPHCWFLNVFMSATQSGASEKETTGLDWRETKRFWNLFCLLGLRNFPRIFPVKWKRKPSFKPNFMRIGMYSFYFSWNMMSASNMYDLFRREICEFLHVYSRLFSNLNFVMFIPRPQTNSLHHKMCLWKLS